MKVKFKNGSEIKTIPTPEEMAIRSIRGREQIEKMAKSANELQLAFENLSDTVKMTNQILKDMAGIKDGIYSKLTWYQKLALRWQLKKECRNDR